MRIQDHFSENKSAVLGGSGPFSSPAPDAPRVAGDYHLECEIARGGMGIVYRAYDPSLGRHLAVKVLRPDRAGDPVLHARFASEARIMGQLQHPGVPPVHQVGRLGDGRPFLAMKLIEGQTLAALLAGRRCPGEGLSLLLGVFEQVCNAVAFAHSRGVVHRDLKPANIMVGPFGEAQVMDWGLAKSIAAECPGPSASLDQPSPVQTGAGNVMGTPAYMAPEQARGDPVDGRADVYALGAILHEGLTGQPYLGGPALLPLLVSRSQPAPPPGDHAPDPELLALARRCLAESPEDRPRDAAAVAEAVRAYQESVGRRLREAELARTRRRLLAGVGVVAGILALVAVGAGLHLRGQWALARAEEEHRLQAQSRRAAAALGEARGQLRRAEAGEGGLVHWAAALGAAEAALRIARENDAPREEADTLGRRLAASRSDLRLAADLVAAREAQARIAPCGTHFDLGAASALARRALARHGLRVGEMGVDEAAAHINARPKAAREHLLAALGLLLGHGPSGPAGARVKGLLDRLDPCPWRREARSAIVAGDRDKLLRLAGDARAAGQPPAAVILLSLNLPAEARLELLRLALRHHPDDFWLHQGIGAAILVRFMPASRYRRATAEERPLAQQGAGHLRAALALRPDSAGALLNLGVMLRFLGESDEAEFFCRRAISREPGLAPAYRAIAEARRLRGDQAGALAALRLGVKNCPGSAAAWANYGVALNRADRPHHAANALRRSLALQPGNPFALTTLGLALAGLGEPAAGLAYLRKAVALAPEDGPALINLADALRRLERYDESERLFRKAATLDPGNPFAVFGLGYVAYRRGDHKKGIALCRRAVALAPDVALLHHELGQLHELVEEYHDARRCFEAALLAEPGMALALLGLARDEQRRGRLAEAARLIERVLAAGPRECQAWMQLASVRRQQGRQAEQLRAARRAAELAPRVSHAVGQLGVAHLERGELPEALACFGRAIRLAPKQGEYHFFRGQALAALGRHAQALDEFRHAISLGGCPGAYPLAVESLVGRRELPAALALARDGVRRYPNDHLTWRGLAWLHYAVGELGPAQQACARSLALSPDDFMTHGLRGQVLLRLGDFDEASESTRRALKSMPSGSPVRQMAERQLQTCLALARVGRRCRDVLEGKVKAEGREELLRLAAFSGERARRPVDAARLCEMALEGGPVPASMSRPEGGAYPFAAVMALEAARLDAPANASRWRGRALGWLKAALQVWKTRPAGQRRQGLGLWLRDGALSRVRGPGLQALPEAERAAWRALWEEVGRLAR